MPDRSPSPDKPYRIAFLLDRTNNWIEEHLRQAGQFSGDERFAFSVSHDHLAVANQDVVFILGYTKILDKAFLQKNSLNLVVHESDLPRGRGFAPTQWQILEGKNEIPVCLLEAAENADSGDIVFRSSIRLTGYELYDEIRLKQARTTFQMITEFLAVYPNIVRTKQTGDGSSYRRRRASDGELDVDKSIRSQFNLLRIGNNEEWPSYFVIDGQKYLLKIFKP